VSAVVTGAKLFSPACLDPDALARARRGFRSHPLRLLVLDGVLDGRAALAVRSFFDQGVSLSASHGLYSANGAVAERRWSAAPVEDRMFRFRVMTGATESESEGAVTFAQLEHALLGPVGGELFEALSGQTLGGPTPVTVYAYGPGDFLARHSDRGGGRQVAFVLYLGDWQPGEGGELRLWHADGRKVDVEPRFNRLVLFDLAAHRHHEVLPVRGTRRRYTIGGWRLHPQAP